MILLLRVQAKSLTYLMVYRLRRAALQEDILSEVYDPEKEVLTALISFVNFWYLIRTVTHSYLF